jgi:phosphatidylglycerophosphate synthase
MKKYTLAQIKESYVQKKEWEKQFPINYFFVRPLSFYLTWLVLKITRNPAKVAIFGFCIGVTGCFFLAIPHLVTLWPGLLLVILYSISDAVDGNVARTTQNVTLFGKYLDGLLGELIDGGYFFFLGVGLYYSGFGAEDPVFSTLIPTHSQAIPLLLGSVILISKLWAAIFRNLYEIYKARKDGLAPFNDFQPGSIIGKSRYHDRWYFRIFVNLESLNTQLLLLILFAVLGIEIWFLLLFACFFAGRALIYLVFYFTRTKSELMNTVKRF